MCTPTRGSAMTGRDPNRYGATWAGRYPLPREEITLGEVLGQAGYRTGFFGQWHLAKLTPQGDEGFPVAKPEPQLYCAQSLFCEQLRSFSRSVGHPGDFFRPF